MKIKADFKDFIMFIVFAVAAFYVIAMAMVNISYFAQTQTFYGLNPLIAFSKDYFASIMAIYLLFMVVIIASVKSHFFEREKGIGFSTNKKTNGYSRWAKKKEIKKAAKKINILDSDVPHSGLPVYYEKNFLYVDDDNHHSLIIGSTGSGKTWGPIVAMIKISAKAGESMILTDPKGELYKNTANILRDKGYKIVVLNLRDPNQGSAWNPLHLPYKLYKEGNTDKATELLNDLAINILYEEKQSNADPFWEKTAADYFSGLALALFDDAEENQINLNSINLMSTVGEERFGGSTYIKEYFDAKDPSKPAYIHAASTINAPNETKGSILSVFKQKIKLFSSKENLSEMLSHNDIDMAIIGKEKTAVFIVIQDEKKTYHPLATTFLKQCYETLIDVAHHNGGKLPIRTNFILDEFANMPPLTDATTMITAARSRAIRFTMVIQNFAQLNQVYGKENAETLKGNCHNIIYLLTGELTALEEISKLCGDRKIKNGDKEETRPLISVTELQTLPEKTAIAIRQRLYPYKFKFTYVFDMNFNEKKLGKAEFVERDKLEVKVFDVKEYVKTQKREKLFETLNQNKKENPMEERPIGERPIGPKPDMSFNVDDLVKRIDAKIAALEEEERLEKEKQGKDKTTKEPVETKPEENKQEKQAENPEKEPKHTISDDQFFDDFFSDDE
ncbi:MAG: type IV secretory system conjugative DNA transfer family protein [Bacilli bacterium]